MTSECCDAEILPPFGAPFDEGEAVCADCGGTVEVNDARDAC